MTLVLSQFNLIESHAPSRGENCSYNMRINDSASVHVAISRRAFVLADRFLLSTVTQNQENGVPALPVSDDNHYNYFHEHTVFTLANQHNGDELPVILLAVFGY